MTAPKRRRVATMIVWLSLVASCRQPESPEAGLPPEPELAPTTGPEMGPDGTPSTMGPANGTGGQDSSPPTSMAHGSGEAEPAAPPNVTVSEPAFVGGGQVPKVEAFLDKMRTQTAKCVADHGGLPEGRGEMSVQFLVTLRGRAEGVDVTSAKGVSKDAQRCVRDAFKNKRVETPTADPTGVQFTYSFE